MVDMSNEFIKAKLVQYVIKCDVMTGLCYISGCHASRNLQLDGWSVAAAASAFLY
jgi:hypothetical protein